MLEVYPMLPGMFRNHLCQEPWHKFNLAEIETSSSAAAHITTALAVLSFLAPMRHQNDEEDLMCFSFKVYVWSALRRDCFFLADNVARAFRAFVDSFFSVTRRMGAAEPLQRNGYACLFYIYYSMSCVNSLRICNKWWRMENGKRVCWHMVPATTEQWNDFPLAQKQKWQSLKYSLARGSRP